MTEPASVADIEQRLADYAEALAELIDEHEKVTEQYARAEAAWERAYHARRAELYIADPKTKVGMIESIARNDAADLFDELALVRQREAFIRHAMRSYQQILSAFQTRGRFVSDQAGHGRYGRH